MGSLVCVICALRLSFSMSDLGRRSHTRLINQKSEDKQHTEHSSITTHTFTAYILMLHAQLWPRKCYDFSLICVLPDPQISERVFLVLSVASFL